jgi:nicotinamide mononucleotide transporter
LTVVDAVLRALAAIPAAEWVAVGFALAYVVLAIRQSAWCWAAAIVSSAIFLVLFARGGLPMQAWLQAFYVAMACYGWWAWRGGLANANGQELRVSRRTLRWNALAVASIIAAGLVNGHFAPGTATSGLVPYVDALTAWGAVFATWMVTRKVLENWLYWVVIDLVSSALYWAQGLHATAGLFIVYAVLAIQGYRQWTAAAAEITPAVIGDGVA